MGSVWIEIAIQFGPLLLLLLIGLLSGTLLERAHFASIRKREQMFASLPASSLRTVPAEWSVAEVRLVTGSVVVSLDYFKRFLAGLRSIVGGRIRAYEPLLERGRREALVRMKQEAARLGCDAVVNVRLETSRLATSKDRGVAGVEMLAFGTGLRLNKAPGARHG